MNINKNCKHLLYACGEYACKIGKEQNDSSFNICEGCEKNKKTSVVDIHKVNGVRPEFDVYIGRYVQYQELQHSKWSNPFTLKKYGEKALELYEDHILGLIGKYPTEYNLNELKGKRLGCWCITTDKLEPLVCHGQVLMKLIEEEFADQLGYKEVEVLDK